MAGRPRIRAEGIVVGIKTVHADRRHLAIEPREERQLLHVIGDTVGRQQRRKFSAAQRIADFQIALASAHLSDVTPQRGRIVADRIVHPFADLVAHRGDRGYAAENSAGVIIDRRVRLERTSERSVVSEDAAIRRVKAAFEEPLRSMVEVRNQARVHLWFEAKFGETYGPLSSAAEALERFASATFAVGVRLESDDWLHIEAPFGLADLFALRLRPNPRRKTVGFARTAADVRRRWPEVVVEDQL